MRKTSAAIAALLLAALPAFAQEEPPAASKEDAEKAAGVMFEVYRYGGAADMLKAEERCWEILRNERWYATESGVAKCSLMSMSGAVIEASYARAQRRMIAPAYTTEGFRARIFNRTKALGWSSERTQSVLVTSVGTNQEGVISGLANAGMR